jgi:hypothetical protein
VDVIVVAGGADGCRGFESAVSGIGAGEDE